MEIIAPAPEGLAPVPWMFLPGATRLRAHSVRDSRPRFRAAAGASV